MFKILDSYNLCDLSIICWRCQAHGYIYTFLHIQVLYFVCGAFIYTYLCVFIYDDDDDDDEDDDLFNRCVFKRDDDDV